MPIVVDEVVITVELTNAAGPSGASGGAGSGAAGGDQQALIAECVARVLDVLRQQKEP